MNTETSPLEGLLMKLLDGRLTHRDRRELATILLDDPDAQAEYLLLLATHTALCQELGSGFTTGGEDELSLVGVAPKPSRVRRAAQRAYEFFRRPTALSMTISPLVVGALVAILAFITVPIMQRRSAAPDPPPLVATITAAHKATWPAGQTPPQVGWRLRAGQQFALRSGLVELTFDSGAKATLVGPTDARVERNGCHIDTGELAANVPPPAIGFTVTTPTAVVVDLGTEFVVRADIAGKTEVSVVRGVVEMTPRGPNAIGAKKIVLTQNEGATASAGGHVLRGAARLSSTHMPQWKPVFIEDASFENVDVDDLLSGAADAWVGTPRDFGLVFDPSEGQFVGTWGNNANRRQIIPQGGQVAVVESTEGFPQTAIEQTLAADVVAGADYALTFWVGRRADIFVPDCRVELLAGETLLAAADCPVAPEPGEFMQAKLTATAPTAAQGKLRIRFRGRGSQTQACLDDIRLYLIEPTPTPSASSSPPRSD